MQYLRRYPSEPQILSTGQRAKKILVRQPAKVRLIHNYTHDCLENEKQNAAEHSLLFNSIDSDLCSISSVTFRHCWGRMTAYVQAAIQFGLTDLLKVTH